MTLARFPLMIYTSNRTFDDYGSDDMQHGDISESRLKSEFLLGVISNVADPFTLNRYTAFNNPQSRFSGMHGGKVEKITLEDCAKLLFNEMRRASLPFSFYGPYCSMINRMLTHLQLSNGAPFEDKILDLAYKKQILDDFSGNSTRLAIQEKIHANIDYKNKGYPLDRVCDFSTAISQLVLPKFDSLLDRINGMAITVHDVHATRIELLSMEVTGTSWRARVKYTAQDHFGLDINDMHKLKFRQFQFFKTWFVLQRYTRFGFRPFLVNMEATIDLEGAR